MKRKGPYNPTPEEVFVTGKVCTNGHEGPLNRYRLGGKCAQCTREYQRLRQERERAGLDDFAKIPAPKTKIKGWPFEQFDDDPRAERREPYWRDSMAYRRNVRAA